MIENIRELQPELEITDEEVKCITIAGLCHDLGHGPFSHAFDSGFMKAVDPHCTWSHEKGSVMMFRDMIEQNSPEINEHEAGFIVDLIMGEPSKKWQANPLLDILFYPCQLLKIIY
ncbi:Deoxynucleoside triphosphate triphosphohydrolase SAMHD1 [Zancudomyces culisetae]|uniref:Deoxynucleoside triphosphate triphosphohydrolase SAMHD1 n=1 Tax=Zancudomyces culisetae TaxID=1213189 RepID=A0A1R1PPL1_ZANCU|nr:Deoxynucleoside triphosphate triphosphohydrolase SAMHD1 [Zancudomyces culisetae]|eukprot:OMH82843.1 Deoxynucleoside triphosphate triphosphohydrolase SAMHD1 [Zancudomyces culisetae]